MPASRSISLTVRQRRPRRRWWWLWTIGVVISVAVAVQSWRSSEPRQSAVRAVIGGHVRSIAQALAIYRDEVGGVGTLAGLLQRGLVDSGTAAIVTPFEYRPQATPASPRVLFMQTKPNRAVRKGEAWGGPGEFAGSDVPASRWVLFDDLSVVQLEENDFQSRYAPLRNSPP
ncbi:MAG: hypothetical protein U1D55_04845 [Phycisphaerae bacterium]